jgi:hypothetical protein
MTLKNGRVTLAVPQRIRYRPREYETLTGPTRLDTYSVESREAGATPQATMDSLEQEARRRGARYVEDTDTLVPEGYYEHAADPGYEKPPGAPKRRPWSFTLSKPPPLFHVVRQAYNDRIAGSEVAVAGTEEGKVARYTPTTGDVVVLRPRTVAGAEKFNLPAGDWRAVLLWKSTVTTSQLVRWRLTDGAGATLSTGAQKTASQADIFLDTDLGVLTSPGGTTWYELLVQGVAGQLNNVDLESVTFYRETTA